MSGRDAEANGARAGKPKLEAVGRPKVDMKLKLDENGHMVVQDGKPVYIADDGKEIAFDAAAAIAKITQLNGEAKGHRERAEQAEAALKAFEGVDPAEARKAVEIVKNLDAKKLVDAGEIERVKAEIAKSYTSQLEEATKKIQTLEDALYGEKIGGSFARSKFIAEKLAIPADLVQARFGSAFKVEDGQIVAYDHTGSKIYSRSRPGEVADFDEALEFLIDNYPQKNYILKSSGGSGGGTPGSRGGGTGEKVMQRSEFEKLDPATQAAKVKEGYTFVD